MEQFDHNNLPSAELLKSMEFNPEMMIRFHRYGGKHNMTGPCDCHPLLLTYHEIHQPSVAELQKRLNNFYRRQ